MALFPLIPDEKALPLRCTCKVRYAARQRGEFVYLADYEGWAFTDGPLRWRDARSQYYAAERGVEDHSGEPFIWHCCFHCGRDLPIPDDGS